MKKRTALVIDSTDNIRSVQIRMLKELGFDRILQATNGETALDLIQENKVDIVISEWDLPKVSGKDLLLFIRKSSDNAKTPFIICSSNVAQQTVKDALASGVSQYIAKPFNFKVFKEKILLAISRPLNEINFKQSSKQSNGGELIAVHHNNVAKTHSLIPVQNQKNFTVLIVDDEINNIEVAAKCIKPICRVQVALNGEKALTICQKSKPDLILLDIMMPGMDGYQVFDNLQENAQLADIPIIFITAKSEDDDVVKGLSLGAVDYITKPFNMKILKMRVQNQLNMVKQIQNLDQMVNEQIEKFTMKENVERIIFNYVTSPLNQIDEINERITKRNLTTKQLKVETDNITHSTRKIRQIINSLNTILQLEDGTFIPQMKSINIYELVAEVINHHYHERIKKSLQVDNNLSIDAVVEGDSTLFYTMLSELYDNALEASPRGTRIAFNESYTEKAFEITLQSATTVPLSIRNNFFDKYTSSGKKSGTGLGTYAAKLIIEACHGSIQLLTSDNETRIVISFKPA